MIGSVIYRSYDLGLVRQNIGSAGPIKYHHQTLSDFDLRLGTLIGATEHAVLLLGGVLLDVSPIRIAWNIGRTVTYAKMTTALRPLHPLL